jgi:hypothetical protein
MTAFVLQGTTLLGWPGVIGLADFNVGDVAGGTAYAWFEIYLPTDHIWEHTAAGWFDLGPV